MPSIFKKQEDWQPEDVLCALRKNAYTSTGLSVNHGYAHNAVSVACRKPWPNVEKIVADALGKHPMDIWPSRYKSNGTPKVARRSWKEYTKNHTSCHVQSEQVA